MENVNDAIREAAKSGAESKLNALLLRPGCDLMSKDEYGRTALIWAAIEGHTACVERLLWPKGAPLLKDERGVTALMWAAIRGHTACVQLLLSVSDPLAENNLGHTASLGARFRGHNKLADFIDAYALARREMAELRASTAPGAARKTAALRV